MSKYKCLQVNAYSLLHKVSVCAYNRVSTIKLANAKYYTKLKDY